MFQFRLCRPSQDLAVLVRITPGECWENSVCIAVEIPSLGYTQSTYKYYIHVP